MSNLKLKTMETFETLFKRRNPEYGFLLNRMRSALEVDEVTFSDINNVNMLRFKQYLTEDIHNSSLKTYMAVVAATIKAFAQDDLCRFVDFKSINRIKCEKSENIALTEDEVEKFANYYDRIKNQNTVERDVLTLFLMECFTGARNSDCQAFDETSISDGFLTYVSKKTHTLTKVPVHRMLPLLIKRLPKKEYCRMTMCRKIKEVAKKLGIDKPERRMYRGELKTRPRYEYIATHTGRRTFVSILLDKGVPLATVSKMAGHQDVQMTLRYYTSDSLVLDESAMSFFNG